MEIEGFENYLIYPDGNVFSKKRNINLKASPNTWGYPTITLSKNNKSYPRTIHRLVALYYLENPDNKPEIDHKDRDKTNNCVENLRWVNRVENCFNTSPHKTSKSGIKNISPKKGGYVFHKTINKKSHEKWFKTLEEAIEYKNNYLKNLSL